MLRRFNLRDFDPGDQYVARVPLVWGADPIAAGEPFPVPDDDLGRHQAAQMYRCLQIVRAEEYPEGVQPLVHGGRPVAAQDPPRAAIVAAGGGWYRVEREGRVVSGERCVRRAEAELIAASA